MDDVSPVFVGSTNPAKVDAAKEVFLNASGMKVDSGVSDQPMTDEETKEGALKRARGCIEKGAFLGIGLEGGVMQSTIGLLSVNWGAIVDRNGKEVLASGARYPLPDEIAVEIMQGHELGKVIDRVTGRKDVRKKEGAVGVFTNGEMTRRELYVHLVRILSGQYRSGI